ncbi:hypothetical protein Q73A0000_11295 [Kaistella flava (ex Peng et al. 2021)]|uniref:DUF4595 domain-containing protein n=1 Tax=Kaistella flava (ex Peng et al. 2021) TaxID=2038776 RepID=A0A7M2Y9S4_9FLAO|nr:hypothetical protein [Kaistella flava (ex Peng et al. 2021)]QOW10901.1 hypothetical protein Q73A0000_11295 [Kaistella flava (ex Peng et al. 2021)]
MKKVLNIFVLIFSLVILFSCEPGRDENGDLLFGVEQPNQNGGGGTTGVVKHLKSVTSKDDSGETVTFNYTYLLGKLVNVKASDNSVSYNLTYDNNNINKIAIVQNDGSITTTNFTITYNNGKFVEAKGVGTEDTGNSFKNTITANYTNNKITKILSKMVGVDSADPNVLYDMFTLQSDVTYTGSNISTWKFSTIFPATPPITIPPIVISTTFSDYDNKINPFNTLPEAYNIVSSLYGFDNSAVTGFSANNYRKIAVNGQSVTYTYTYDADGYPTKAVASGNLGTLTFVYQ